MLYFLLTHFIPHATFTHLCHYITFRSAGAILTSLFVSFLCGPRCIAWLKRLQKEGQPFRLEGPVGHSITKKGTPTMGGVLIMFSVGVSLLFWGDLSNSYLLVGLFTLVFYGMIGFFDDYLKVVERHSKGLAGKKKLVLQLLGGCISVVWIQYLAPPDYAHHLALPFFKDVLLPLGMFYIPFAVFVLIGSSNAVNLTDGLDGLAIVPIMIALGCFAIISYLTGHNAFAQYLHLHYIAGSNPTQRKRKVESDARSTFT